MDVNTFLKLESSFSEIMHSQICRAYGNDDVLWIDFLNDEQTQ